MHQKMDNQSTEGAECDATGNTMKYNRWQAKLCAKYSIQSLKCSAFKLFGFFTD